jgi:hypothetical protein
MPTARRTNPRCSRQRMSSRRGSRQIEETDRSGRSSRRAGPKHPKHYQNGHPEFIILNRNLALDVTKRAHGSRKSRAMTFCLSGKPCVSAAYRGHPGGAGAAHQSIWPRSFPIERASNNRIEIIELRRPSKLRPRHVRVCHDGSRVTQSPVGKPNVEFPSIHPLDRV